MTATMHSFIHVEDDVWFIPFNGMYWRFNRANIESVVRMIYDMTSVHPPSLPIRDGKMMFSERKGAIMLSYIEYEGDDGSKMMQGIFATNPECREYKYLLGKIRCALQDSLDLPLAPYKDREIIERIQASMNPFNFID